MACISDEGRHTDLINCTGKSECYIPRRTYRQRLGLQRPTWNYSAEPSELPVEELQGENMSCERQGMSELYPHIGQVVVYGLSLPYATKEHIMMFDILCACSLAAFSS